MSWILFRRGVLFHGNGVNYAQLGDCRDDILDSLGVLQEIRHGERSRYQVCKSMSDSCVGYDDNSATSHSPMCI